MTTALDDKNRPIGWFRSDQANAYVREVKKIENGVVVELGTWLGRSLSYIVNICEQKKTELYAVDLWTGAGPEKHYGAFRRKNNVKDVFIANMQEVGLWDRFHMIQGDTVEVANQFEDKSCDLIFVDADHTYESCFNDIQAWWSKLKVGGLMMGHDYTSTWPGVIKAVRQVFGEADVVKCGMWFQRRREEHGEGFEHRTRLGEESTQRGEAKAEGRQEASP